jgi:hypothetical protein
MGNSACRPGKKKSKQTGYGPVKEFLDDDIESDLPLPLPPAYTAPTVCRVECTDMRQLGLYTGRLLQSSGDRMMTDYERSAFQGLFGAAFKHDIKPGKEDVYILDLQARPGDDTVLSEEDARVYFRH